MKSIASPNSGGTPNYWPGITASLLSSLGFASMDAITKRLVETVPVVWVLIIRSALIAVIIGVALLMLRRSAWFGSRARGVLGLRSLLFGLTTVIFVMALERLPLAEAVALYFISPVFIVLMAAWLLGEPLTWRALFAAVVGFIGVLLIVQPQTGNANWHHALPLAAAVSGALQEILVRRMRAVVHPSTIVFYGTIATVVVTLIALPLGATPTFSGTELGLIGAGALAGLLAFFYVTVSFQKAPTRIVAPLRYLNIVWAVVLGYFVWGSVPDPFAALGIGCIMIAGVACVWKAAGASR